MADVTINQLPSKTSASSTDVLPITDGTTTSKITVSNLLGGSLPIGFIGMWYGSVASIPSGWALCNGQTVNGYTTPNLQDRFIVGAGSGYGVGATGGASTVTLSVNEMPSHNHGINDPSHAHSVPRDWRTPGSIDSTGAGSESGGSNGGYNFNTLAASTGITIQNNGGNAAHENRPPYYALAYIMKVA